MKKLVVLLASAAILAIGTAGAAFAQTPTPQQGWGHMGWGANGSYDPAKNPVVQKMADKLGITASDLVAQVKGGKSVADVAGSPEKVDALVDVIQAPMAEMMKVMAEYGYADQAQIDSMLNYMREYTKNSLEQKGVLGFGMMGQGMMGNAGGMMGGNSGMMGGSGSSFGGMMGGNSGMMGGSGSSFGGMMGGR